MSIAARLAALRGELPAGVTLVAVSKTQPPEAIREAYAAGQRDFGENYAQEWRAKADALADLADLRWHFIGGLQANKVKYLAGRVAYVHTVDREALAREISARFAARGAVARVFLEVNVGAEAPRRAARPPTPPAWRARWGPARRRAGGADVHPAARRTIRAPTSGGCASCAICSTS